MAPELLAVDGVLGQFIDYATRTAVSPRAPFHKAAIWPEFTKLYTSAAEPYIGAEYANQKEKPRATIHQPCACLWGVTVPAPFWKAIEGSVLGDGSLARFLVSLTDEHYPARQDTPEPAEPPAELLAGLTAIAAGAGGPDHGSNLAEAMQAGAAITPYTVPLTPAAETAMAASRQHAVERLRAHQGTYATALFARHAENTAKLAMLAAISRIPARPVTEEHDVTWARRLVDHGIGTPLREADRHVAEACRSPAVLADRRWQPFLAAVATHGCQRIAPVAGLPARVARAGDTGPSAIVHPAADPHWRENP